MRIKTKRRFIWTSLIGFLFWLLGAYLYHYELNTSLQQGGVQAFEKAFQLKSKNLYEELIIFANEYPEQKSLDDRFQYAEERSKKSGFNFYCYLNDTLDLWTSNKVVPPDLKDKTWNGNTIALLQNGWYKMAAIQKGNRLFVGLFLIKNQYKYENEDLVNEFSKDLANNLKGEIIFGANGFPIHDAQGNKIFSIVPSDSIDKNETLEVIIFTFYLLGFIILLQLFINACQRLLISKPVLLIGFPILIVVLRYISLKTPQLNVFSNFELFNPELFASSEWAPSLGDLIINITIFYFLVHFLLKRTRNWFEKGNLKLKLVVFLVPLFLTSFYVAFQINEIIYSLVYNSKITFDLQRLFDLNLYSFISIGLIGVSFYVYFKLIEYIIIQLKKSNFEWNRLAFLWVITSSIYILIDQFYFEQNILTSMWPIFLSGSLLWFHFNEKDYKFAHVISMLAFIAFYASYILQGYSTDKEREIRKFQAEKIAQDKDFLTEIDYAALEEKLIKDRFVLPFFYGDYHQSYFSDLIEKAYFERLKNKYEFKFFLYDSKKALRYDPRNFELKKFKRFDEIINTSGEISQEAENIFFITDYTDKLNYVSRLPIVDNDSIYGYLITEFRSKKFPEDIGLPSLLLDDRTPTSNQFKNYSIAKYVDNQLVTAKGDFNYPTVTANWFTTPNRFVNKNKFSHYIYQAQSNNYTLVSKKTSTGIGLFTSFSYLLIIYGVLLLIPIGYNQLERGISFDNIKLNVKIQVVLIGLIFSTLVAFAIGAGTYVAQQNLETNKDLIKEKIESVKTELQSKFKDYDQLKKKDSDYLEFKLKKFSTVFVTDINVYNEEGNLLASSQPKIYSQGLLSRKMNTAAFRAIHLNNKSEFIHQENIGRLNYLSAYKAFYNQKGKFLAYVNVQYISRQHDLENQISGFLLAIINIMVFMLAFSTILSITVSNRLIRPLKYIQDSLKTVQIGATSKPIGYNRNDEIGDLVKEYNKKVEELQKNAEALAKSERESAWREMAKQVAHEIKNPLTPMKLSIQHLKRSINVSDEESKSKLDRVSKSLIEQIDALTKIANEFSNFAKMPKAKETELDLAEVLKNTVAVFSEYDQHKINLTIVPQVAMVWADKDLLLRVFNNLIKNALQAIPVGNNGIIDINLKQNQTNFEVTVKDNGIGIKEAEQEKIFVPYFTTKSKGTGLGLAMSKQIIESMEGKIWFESKYGEGTTFFVNFPQLK